MNFKITFLITCLFICMFAIASVCASDVNDTDMVSEDISGTLADNLKISEETVSQSPDGGTFTDLQIKINGAGEEGTVNLTNDYKYDDGFSSDGINIPRSITINGNGFKIDGLGLSRIFTIDASSKIILNDITFVNGKSTFGSAINFNNDISECIINNCKFIDNNATQNGGALYCQ